MIKKTGAPIRNPKCLPLGVDLDDNKMPAAMRDHLLELIIENGTTYSVKEQRRINSKQRVCKKCGKSRNSSAKGDFCGRCKIWKPTKNQLRVYGRNRKAITYGKASRNP